MEAGSQPRTNDEIIDPEAISALKESAANELKDQGNEYVKKGKKYYSDAIDCYTRAINQKALNNSEQSILYSNRAHVNLLLGNYRCALHDAEISKAVATAKAIVSALEDWQLKMGNAMYQELTGVKKPMLDKNNMLHWPVIFLYAEVMSSDIIEDFCETDTFSVHIVMFSENSPPLPWDTGNVYTRDFLELYYEEREKFSELC